MHLAYPASRISEPGNELDAKLGSVDGEWAGALHGTAPVTSMLSHSDDPPKGVKHPNKKKKSKRKSGSQARNKAAFISFCPISSPFVFNPGHAASAAAHAAVASMHLVGEVAYDGVGSDVHGQGTTGDGSTGASESSQEIVAHRALGGPSSSAAGDPGRPTSHPMSKTLSVLPMPGRGSRNGSAAPSAGRSDSADRGLYSSTADTGGSCRNGSCGGGMDELESSSAHAAPRGRRHAGVSALNERLGPGHLWAGEDGMRPQDQHLPHHHRQCRHQNMQPHQNSSQEHEHPNPQHPMGSDSTEAWGAGVRKVQRPHRRGNSSSAASETSLVSSKGWAAVAEPQEQQLAESAHAPQLHPHQPEHASHDHHTNYFQHHPLGPCPWPHEQTNGKSQGSPSQVTLKVKSAASPTPPRAGSARGNGVQDIDHSIAAATTAAASAAATAAVATAVAAAAGGLKPKPSGTVCGGVPLVGPNAVSAAPAESCAAHPQPHQQSQPQIRKRPETQTRPKGLSDLQDLSHLVVLPPVPRTHVAGSSTRFAGRFCVSGAASLSSSPSARLGLSASARSGLAGSPLRILRWPGDNDGDHPAGRDKKGVSSHTLQASDNSHNRSGSSSSAAAARQRGPQRGRGGVRAPSESGCSQASQLASWDGYRSGPGSGSGSGPAGWRRRRSPVRNTGLDTVAAAAAACALSPPKGSACLVNSNGGEFCGVEVQGAPLGKVVHKGSSGSGGSRRNLKAASCGVSEQSLLLPLPSDEAAPTAARSSIQPFEPGPGPDRLASRTKAARRAASAHFLTSQGARDKDRPPLHTARQDQLPLPHAARPDQPPPSLAGNLDQPGPYGGDLSGVAALHEDDASQDARAVIDCQMPLPASGDDVGGAVARPQALIRRDDSGGAVAGPSAVSSMEKACAGAAPGSACCGNEAGGVAGGPHGVISGDKADAVAAPCLSDGGGQHAGDPADTLAESCRADSAAGRPSSVSAGADAEDETGAQALRSNDMGPLVPAATSFRERKGILDAQTDGVSDLQTEGISDIQKEGMSDLDRLLDQVTPLLSLDPELPSCQALRRLRLEAVWRFFEEPSVYGQEVWALGGQRGPSMCFFVPYLSAMQLFTPVSPRDGLKTYSLYTSNSSQGPSEPMQLRAQHFETETPFNRVPLFEQIEDMAAAQLEREPVPQVKRDSVLQGQQEPVPQHAWNGSELLAPCTCESGSGDETGEPGSMAACPELPVSRSVAIHTPTCAWRGIAAAPGLPDGCGQQGGSEPNAGQDEGPSSPGARQLSLPLLTARDVVQRNSSNGGTSNSGSEGREREKDDRNHGSAGVPEQERPPEHQPLQGSFLFDTRISELHPASWFSVAWYPVYRIPDAPLCARFLTYHSFGPLVQRVRSAVAAEELGQSCPTGAMPLEVSGLKWYNFQGERWLQPLSREQVTSGQAEGLGAAPGSRSNPRSQAMETPQQPAAEAARQAHLGALQVNAESLARGYGLRLVGPNGSEKVRQWHPDFEFFNSRS